MSRPAALGGEPAFAEPLPFVRPTVPPLERVVARLTPSYERGMLTNGPLVRAFEEQAAAKLGVPHVVAVSSCTAGLMLVLRVLAPEGPVVLPSFTFSASAHAVAWNGLEPRFVECDRASFQVDPASVRDRIDGAGAVLATHVFGAPCDVETLESIAAGAGIPILFDSAHAFGAFRGDRAVGGFGAAEIFSLSPTKVVVAGEGGVVATRDGALADALASGATTATPATTTRASSGSTRGCRSCTPRSRSSRSPVSTSGSSNGAASSIAIATAWPSCPVSSRSTSTRTTARPTRTSRSPSTSMRSACRATPSSRRCAPMASTPGATSRRRCTGSSRTATSPYDLPVTDAVAAQVVSLPIYASLSDDQVDTVTRVLGALHRHADEVRAVVEA